MVVARLVLDEGEEVVERGVAVVGPIVGAAPELVAAHLRFERVGGVVELGRDPFEVGLAPGLDRDVGKEGGHQALLNGHLLTRLTN